jgi:hypothetical protein
MLQTALGGLIPGYSARHDTRTIWDDQVGYGLSYASRHAVCKEFKITAREARLLPRVRFSEFYIEEESSCINDCEK